MIKLQSGLGSKADAGRAWKHKMLREAKGWCCKAGSSWELRLAQPRCDRMNIRPMPPRSSRRHRPHRPISAVILVCVRFSCEWNLVGVWAPHRACSGTRCTRGPGQQRWLSKDGSGKMAREAPRRRTQAEERANGPMSTPQYHGHTEAATLLHEPMQHCEPQPLLQW